MNSSAKLLRQHISDIATMPTTRRKLWVFDFDDTLVRTTSKIYVTRADGSRYDLTPAQFAVKERRSDETYDYSDFHELLDPKPIKWMNRILESVYAHQGPKDIRILSARSADAPIHKYLSSRGLDGITVVALNNSRPELKSMWVDSWLEQEVFDEVEFFDDSRNNVSRVRALQEDWPTVRIIVRTIVHNRIASLYDE